MKKIFILVLTAAMLLTLASCGGATVSSTPKLSDGTVDLMDASWQKTADGGAMKAYLKDAHAKSVNKAVTDLSFKLFREIGMEDISSGRNVMLSPVSLISAMGIVENGAAGATLESLEKGSGISLDDLNAWYDAWSSTIMADKDHSLKTANSLWFKDDYLDMSEDYLRKVREVYDADIYGAPFDDSTIEDMNRWADSKTDGMIHKIVGEEVKKQCLAAMNAVIFDDTWRDKYREEDVHEHAFFNLENGDRQLCTMLTSYDEGWPYFEDENFTGTTRYYKSGYSINLILPKEGMDMADAVDKLTGEAYRKLIDGTENKNVYLELPEFSYDYSTETILDKLEAMGIGNLRPGEADFSLMTNDPHQLGISFIVQKTRIELDRKGTKAAAITIVFEEDGCADPGEDMLRNIILNRPFIFVICDRQGEPVFIGTMSDITAGTEEDTE